MNVSRFFVNQELHYCGNRLNRFGLKQQLHSLASVASIPFVHTDPSYHEIYELSNFIQNTSNLVCITGAGVSTSSGLPDYRGENGSYKRGHKPMVHSEFISNISARQRYWTRSMVGFERMSKSAPNDCHNALSSLEQHNKLGLIITQNVDGLHQKASSRNVIDLHGRIDENICLQCGALSSRDLFQSQLHKSNPVFSEQLTRRSINVSEIRADGDVDLGSFDHSTFCVPGCELCGGTVKPHVVFFGDNVPLRKVEEAYAQVDKSDGLLIIGTSLEVFSAYRFVLRADKLGVPIAIVNHGETRAERAELKSVQFKSDANCGLLLKEVAERVCV